MTNGIYTHKALAHTGRHTHEHRWDTLIAKIDFFGRHTEKSRLFGLTGKALTRCYETFNKT